MRKEFFECLTVLARAAEVPELQADALAVLVHCCAEMRELQALGQRRACWAEFWRETARDWPPVVFVAEGK